MRLHFAVSACLLIWCIPGKCICVCDILIFYEAFCIFRWYIPSGITEFVLLSPYYPALVSTIEYLVERTVRELAIQRSELAWSFSVFTSVCLMVFDI